MHALKEATAAPETGQMAWLRSRFWILVFWL